MTTHTLLFMLLVSIVDLASARAADAGGCVRCAFAGYCGQGQGAVPCGPSQARCLLDEGILVVAATAPDGSWRAVWQLFARRRHVRSLGRLAGKLKAWSDVEDPGFPGFPGRRPVRSDVYWGRPGRFDGRIADDRLSGVARYSDGSTCDLHAVIVHGVGADVPNDFVCRAPSGEVIAAGGLQVGIIRLRGCRR